MFNPYMSMNNNNNNAGMDLSKILPRIQQLTDDELNNFVQQARSMGISEENISQGLVAINSMRNKNNRS